MLDRCRLLRACGPIALFLALTPRLAAAQSSTGELTDEPEARSRIAADLGLYYRTVMPMFDLGMVQPSLYGTFGLADIGDEGILQLDVAWRLAGLFGRTSSFRAANPYVGVRLGVHHGTANDQWRVRGGLGLTAPITNAYDDFGGGAASLAPILLWAVFPGMQGAYDAWLQSPLNMALVFRGDVEYRGELFAVGGDTAIAALFPVTYRGTTGDTVVDLQVGAWGAVRPIPELALGLRFQAVALVTTRNTMGMSNTEGYTSLIPFVRAELGPAFVEARWLLNLDAPYGWSFDTSGAAGGSFVHVWSVQLTGGTNF